MAGHAQLNFVMTECSKTQIRLTGLTYSFLNGTLEGKIYLPTRRKKVTPRHTKCCPRKSRSVCTHAQFDQGQCHMLTDSFRTVPCMIEITISFSLEYKRVWMGGGGGGGRAVIL